MGIILQYISHPGSIDEESWTNFVGYYAPILILILALTVALILWRYSAKARNFKIRVPSDVFAPFHPMRALWWFVAGAIVAAIAAGFAYQLLLQTWDGLFGFAALMLLIVAVFSLLLSYLGIALFAGLTPPKFRYRAASFSKKDRSAR